MNLCRKSISINTLLAFSAFLYFFLFVSTINAQLRKIYAEPGNSNAIRKFSFYSPSEGYVASAGYNTSTSWIGYTSDSGRTFSKKFITNSNVNYGYNPVSFPFGLNIYGVKAFSQNKVFVYGDYGYEPSILYSTDGGNTFTLIYWSGYTGSLTNGILDMVFPENSTVGYAIDDNRILKTNNQGLSWSVIASFPGYNFSKLEAVDNNNVFVLSTGSTNNGFLKTNNAGANWQNASLPPLAGYYMSYAHFLTAATGWVNMVNYDSEGYFYKTTDGGDTWTMMNNAITSFTCSKIKFTDVTTGYAVSDKLIYKTLNGGKNWEPLPRDNDLITNRTDLQFISANQLWAGGNNNLIEISTNSGGTPIPKSYCGIDASGVTATGIVNLLNYSRTDYTYKWFVNNTLVSTTYNASYTHTSNSELDTIKLVVSNGTDTDTSIAYQSFYPRARIVSFTPATAGAGTNVIINGLNLTSVTAVSFGGVNAAGFTIESPTKITAVVGNGASGNVKIVATTGRDSLAGFNFISPPAVNAVSPLASVAGTTVTITGTNFSTATAVYFDSVPAASFTIVSPTVITAVTPSGGSGAITIVAAGGISQFPGYIALPDLTVFSPSSGTQGSVLIITGTSLKGITTVTVGGVNVLSFIINSSTRITANVGNGGTGDVMVSKPGGSSSLPGYTWLSSPVINSFSPAAGPVGTTVTITGTGFNTSASSNIVYFGAVRAAVTAANTTTLTVTVPIGATFEPISVFNTATNLTAFSPKPFLLTYTGGNLSGYTYGTGKSMHPNNIPMFATLKDMDGDGKPDVLVSASTISGEDGELLVYRNTSTIGSAVFQNPVTIEQVGFRQPIAADLDGDGKADLALLSSDVVNTLLNTSTSGNISFANGPVLEGNGTFNQISMAVGDADGDGKPDIVTSNGRVFRNISTPGNIRFEQPINVFGRSRNVLLTDLNGDTKPDLVFSDRDNTFYVLKNISAKGMLSFEAPVGFEGFDHFTMVDGDIDGDGKTDLVSVDYANFKLGIIRNTSTAGSFSFDNAVVIPVKDSPIGIAVSDVDGDGKADIAITLSNFDLTVLRNTSTTGAISLEDQVNFISGVFNYNHTPALGDIDGDGKNDAVTTVSYPAGTVSVYLNTFSNKPSIESFAPLSGKLGDTITIRGTNFTGASNVSFGGITATSFIVESPTIIKAVLSTGTTGDVSVTTTKGTASAAGFTYLPLITSFTPASGIAGTTVTVTGLSFIGATNVSFGGAAAVSFTVVSDTIITAVVGTGATGKVEVTNTAGTAVSVNDFTFNASVGPIITSVNPIAADKGATVTIFGSNFSSSITGNNVYFGTIKAQVATATANTLTVIVPTGSVYEHVMVTTNYLTAISPKPFVTTFAGGGNFTAASFSTKQNVITDYPVEEMTYPQFKDFNGDHLLDIVFPLEKGFNIAKNTTTNGGQISFGPMQSYLVPIAVENEYFSGNFEVGDFDGDGRPDIVKVADNGTLGIRRNISTNSEIKFDTLVRFRRIGLQAGGGAASIAIADINKDGKPDITVRNPIGSSVSVYLNTSIGASLNFDDPIEVFTGFDITSVKMEDIDNDQMPDLIVNCIHNSFDNPSDDSLRVFVLRNATIGNDISFTSPIGFATAPTYNLSIGDLDGDSKPEIIMTDSYQGLVILRNISTPGNISFAPEILMPIPYDYSYAFGLNDLNGDGKPEIFATSYNADSVFVYQNASSPGNIKFLDRYSYQIGNAPDGIVSGDLDGDGKPEIGVVVHHLPNPAQNAIAILTNQMGTAVEKVCAGSNTSLHSSVTGTVYQWQQNTGTGFTNLSADSVDTDITTATLQLKNIPASYNGYQYKCIVDGVAGNITTLMVSSTATTATVTIATESTSVCAGATITFTATPSAGITAPLYQWQVNGVNAGTNSATFTSAAPDNNSQVKCLMTITNTSGCNTTVTVNSNTITMVVNTVAPTIIVSGNTNVTKDSVTTISSAITNGGISPVYKWQDSTSNHSWLDVTGASNSNINYTPTTTGDKIRCIVNSNADCANPASVTSNVLSFTVNIVTAINPVPGGNAGIRQYPNPVNNVFTIDSLKIADQWQTLQILSTNGKNDEPPINISNRTMVSVPVQQLAPGFYIAVLRRKQGAPVYFKFIKL